MAKKSLNVKLKGEFNLDTMQIHEVKKEQISTYDLLAVLREFDGKTVDISIGEQVDLPTVEE